MTDEARATLREALTRFGIEWDNESWDWADEEFRDVYREHFADALLAGPLARLLADRQEVPGPKTGSTLADQIRQSNKWMRRYQPMCSYCGAAVVSKNLHEEWHSLMRRATGLS